MEHKIYDVVIIGGGPAGLASGIYAARARMKALLIDNYGIDGQALSTNIIENYPGFTDDISGFQLIENLKVQAKKFGLEIISDEVVSINYTDTSIEQSRKNIEIKTGDETCPTISAISVIIASGIKPKQLGIPGEKEFKGCGVSYCATCDAALYKNKTVVVVGGGDTAIEESLFLTKFADKVFVVHRRDKLRATKILQERVLANKKINFLWNSQITEIIGNKKVENVLIKNIVSSQNSKINCDGVFIFVGYIPKTEYLTGVLKLDENGYIITDDEMKTNKAGIFAAGDCRKKLLKQVVTACADGAIAAFSAEKYVNSVS
ncbi:MAG: thioredoxin-disulfide reductase [Elusimicrobiota bacterium]